LFRSPFLYRTIFGLAGFLFFIGSGAALATLIYALNIYLLSVILLLFSGLVIWGYYKYRTGTQVQTGLSDEDSSTKPSGREKLLGGAIFGLIILGLGITWSSRTDKFIMSPWEVLPSVYGWLAGVSVFLLMIWFFIQRSSRMTLILLIGCSILIHSYLIFVYQNGFGGDHWRHVSYQEQIIDERPIPPTLYSPQGTTKISVGPLAVPAVLTDSRIGYSFAWGSLALISKLTITNPLGLNIWLYPMLWAVGLPLLFYLLGRLLLMGRSYAFLLATMPLVFDLYQVGGSLSVPLSLSFLFFMVWVVFTILWLRGRLNKPKLLIPITLLFLFQYPVVTIFWFLWLLPMAWDKLAARFGARKHQIIMATGYILAVILIILVDTYDSLSIILWSRLTHPSELWSLTWAWLVTLMTGMRTPILAMTDLSWLNLIKWVLVITGIWATYSRTDQKYQRLLKPFISLLVVSLVLSYIGTVLMDGLRLIIGRIDLMLNLFTLPFMVYGIRWFNDRSRHRGVAVVLASFIVSLTLYHNYVNAPSLKTVTGDELRIAQSLYDKSLNTDPHPCVIAEEWQLLAVQKASRNRLQGGGFPVERDFIQSEKDTIFYGILSDPVAKHAELINRAFTITGASQCYYLYENRFSTSSDTLDSLTNTFGPSQKNGEVYLFTISR
jgi:hypothetical protein